MELRSVLARFEELNGRLNAAQESAATVTRTETQHSRVYESRHVRRQAQSPSAASVADSTVDVFDSELRQKYMRAVAYLRILDEAASGGEEGPQGPQREQQGGVDIQFVIQQVISHSFFLALVYSELVSL